MHARWNQELFILGITDRILLEIAQFWKDLSSVEDKRN